jgi:hypothetical protein
MEEGVSVKGGIRKEGRSWRGAFDGKETMIFLGRTLSIDQRGILCLGLTQWTGVARGFGLGGPGYP